MSEQAGGLLATNGSYNFNRDTTNQYRTQSIDGSKLAGWQKDHMYHSSYAHFHSRDSAEPKNKAIPGYGGYIPYVKPQGIHAKGYTPISKDSFSSQKLAKNILGLSTSGFNVNKQAFLDQSKLGSSSKYGKTAIQKSHPAWGSGSWVSTTQDFHRNPNTLQNPTFRDTDKFSQTVKPATISSGYSTNHAYLDGQGWNPDRVLRGDNHRSEYRDRFNAKFDFHRDTNTFNKRKLKLKQSNYKYN